jgi:hypothetical protein
VFTRNPAAPHGVVDPTQQLLLPPRLINVDTSVSFNHTRACIHVPVQPSGRESAKKLVGTCRFVPQNPGSLILCTSQVITSRLLLKPSNPTVHQHNDPVVIQGKVPLSIHSRLVERKRIVRRTSCVIVLTSEQEGTI